MSEILLVKQQYSNDCGIACVAMVMHIEYQVVYDALLSLYPNHTGAITHRQLDTLITYVGGIPIRGMHEIYGELLPDNLYIMSLLPASIDSSIGHFIVVDTRCTPYAIFDPSTNENTYNTRVPKIWGQLVKINT